MGTAGEGSPAFDASKDATRFDSVRAGEAALRLQLWEPLEPGSTMFSLSDVVVLIPAACTGDGGGARGAAAGYAQC
jgi:hypothetical protein